jgi:O-antigen/teichoic acid export membrane protein
VNSVSLTGSAKSALVWSAGFTILRDALQFLGMVILVRLLSPADYGRAAFALAVLGVVSALSFKSVIIHALQFRNPAEIDWQSQFTAGMIINAGAALMMALISAALWGSSTYGSSAPLVAALGIGLLIELPSTLRFTMIQTAHDWAKYRVLALLGCLFAMGVSIAVAVAGGGAWALLAGPALFGVPAAIDLFFFARWRPDFSWRQAEYWVAVRFGANRAASTIVTLGRQLAENSTISALFSFSTLGFFTRSFGLSMMVAGRVGVVGAQTLYPILTRAQAGSGQFQRMSALVLRGAGWITIPAATFLSCNAHEIVALLYGLKWLGVVPLLPIMAAVVAMSGLAQCASQLLLANEHANLCLRLDLASAAGGIILVAALFRIPLLTYLLASAILAATILVVTLYLLTTTVGISLAGIANAFFPPVVASAVGTASLVVIAHWRAIAISPTYPSLLVTVFLSGLIFTVMVIAVLRLFWAQQLLELLLVVPGGVKLVRVLHLIGNDR